MTGKTLEEEIVTTLSVALPIVGEEPPIGGLVKETGQLMQGSQDSQDPKVSKIPTSQSPHLERTPSPIRTVFPQSLSDKGALGDTPLSKQTGEPCFLKITLHLYFLFQFFFFFLFLFFEFLLFFLLLGQASEKSAPSVASSLESESSEGECELLPLCFLFLSFFPFALLFFFYMAKSPASLPLAILPLVLHPFFNLPYVLS